MGGIYRDIVTVGGYRQHGGGGEYTGRVGGVYIEPLETWWKESAGTLRATLEASIQTL